MGDKSFLRQRKKYTIYVNNADPSQPTVLLLRRQTKWFVCAIFTCNFFMSVCSYVNFVVHVCLGMLIVESKCKCYVLFALRVSFSNAGVMLCVVCLLRLLSFFHS